MKGKKKGDGANEEKGEGDAFVILPPVSQSYLLKAHFLLRAGGRTFTPHRSHTLFFL